MRCKLVGSCSWGVLVLAALGGCGDDSPGGAEESQGTTQSPTTGTGSDPGTGSEPTTTTTTPTSTGSGATEDMTSTSTGTTEGVDPTLTTTDPSTTGTTTEADTTGTGTTDPGSSSTGAPCLEEGIFCEGDVAMACDDRGEVKFEEACAGECIDGVGCAECLVPSPEVCDGVDNDCDGVADGGEVCGPGSCFGGGGACTELPVPVEQTLVSGCAQPFPPAQGLPCPIDEPGQVFHLSAANGDDANDGLTPETAWKTLCHAVDAAAPGGTLRVAEGEYASSEVYVGKALTIKGGYDASFATWDPDAHPTTYYGRLTLDHNAAVFGGFRVIANPLVADAWSYAHHFVGAGTLVRNYIEIVAADGMDADILNLYGIVASACPGGVTVLRCNDIYVRSSAPQTFVVSAIEYGNHALHAGHGVLDGNRVCQDGGGSATDAVGGYGSCFPQGVSLMLRNNVIEKAGGGGRAMDFYNCGVGDMDFTVTNNTFLSSGDGVLGSGDPAFKMRWKLTNNILFSTGNGSAAVDLGAGDVEISTSEGNLTFGFQNNAILPAPLLSAGDDTSGVATPASVFVDANAGDLHLAPAGQGVGAGLNVYGLPAYGTVRLDVEQNHRPPQGAWDRGAHRN